MIIKVNSGGGSLSNYLIYGKNNSRDSNKIIILEGNASLTDSISKSIDAQDKHFHFILSMNGKRTDEEMIEVYKDFRKELLYSYSKEEVNILAVQHNDTNNTHIHLQIPKRNLLHQTKLDLYFHKRDMKRFEMIRDYLNVKHSEKPPQTPSQSNPSKNWQYNPTAIKTKQEKKIFENNFLDNLYENRNKFNSYEQLLQYIKKDLGLNISKVGYDYNKDDFYLTIKHKDDEGKSQRIFSPLFNNGSSKYITKENGEKEYIKHDFNTAPLEKQREFKKTESLAILRSKLDKMQEVEKKRVDKRLGRMKKLSKDRIDSIKSETPPLASTSPSPPKINYTDLKKESSIQDTAQEYNLLQKLQNINLAEIATKEYNYKFIQRSDKFDLIQEKDTDKKLLVYKDNDGYKYINPYNKKDRGDIANFLKKSAKLGMYGAILDLMNPLKAYLSIFKDLIKISEMILNITLDTILEKDLIESDEINSDKKITKRRTPSIRGADLKPFSPIIPYQIRQQAKLLYN